MERNSEPLENRARARLLKMERLSTSEYSIEGGLVAVDHAYISFFDTPSPPPERHVSIYISGLPHRPELNTASYPQDITLVGDLLRGSSTELIVIKPEGLDEKAYRGQNGQITGDKVTRVSLDQLLKICEKNGINPYSDTVDFTFFGYSEGSSQGASIARVLLERGAHVCGIIGAEPSGITGYDSPEMAKIYPNNVLKFATPSKKRRIIKHVVRTELGHHLSKDLIQSYDTILEGEKPTTKDSFSNMLSVLRRLTCGLVGVRTSRRVVRERLKLAWSINPDYENLLKAGVPLIVFSGTRSEVFPIDEVRQSLHILDQQYPSLITHITSDTRHLAPNITSKGIGIALALMQRREKTIHTQTSGDIRTPGVREVVAET